jgi:hypothetical protein
MSPHVSVPSDQEHPNPSPDSEPAPAPARELLRERWLPRELVIAVLTWVVAFTLIGERPPLPPPPRHETRPAQPHGYRDEDLIARAALAVTDASGEA